MERKPFREQASLTILENLSISCQQPQLVTDSCQETMDGRGEGLPKRKLASRKTYLSVSEFSQAGTRGKLQNSSKSLE